MGLKGAVSEGEGEAAGESEAAKGPDGPGPMLPRQHSEAWAVDGDPRAELDLTEVFTGPRDNGRGRTCKENEAKYSKNSFMSFPGFSEPIWGEKVRVSLETGLVS